MKTLRLILLHLVLAATAFLMVRLISTRVGADRSGRQAGNDTSSREVASRSKSRAASAGRGLDAAGYQAVWDEIAKRRLNRTERESLQTALLKDWAATDLEGALRAVMQESWRGDVFSQNNPFAKVFVDRSEDVLRMIRERKFGILETTMLTKAWMGCLLDKDKELFFTYLGSLDNDGFNVALKGVSSRLVEPGMVSRLLSLANGREGLDLPVKNSYFLDAAVKELGKEALLEGLAAAKGAMADFYAGALARECVNSAPNADAGQVEARISSIPEDQRALFAVSLLNQSTPNAAFRQTALRSLVESEAWQYLDQESSGQVMRSMAYVMEPAALAEWVRSLPARTETAELFHRGVEPYIRKDPAAAWQWIDGLQDPFWRDRALAEYSQVNLHVFNNPEASAQAIGQIRDATFRETVRAWRAAWEKQRGQ